MAKVRALPPKPPPDWPEEPLTPPQPTGDEDLPPVPIDEPPMWPPAEPPPPAG